MTATCAWCARYFALKPSDHRRGRRFCSAECYRKSRRGAAQSRSFARLERLRRGGR